MDLVEKLNSMLLLRFNFWCLLLYSLVENKIRIATSLKHSVLIGFLIFKLIIFLLLTSKTLLFKILNVEFSHRCVIELVPFTIIWRLFISLLDVAVVVTSIC